MTQTNVDYSQNPTGQELLDDYLTKEQENILTSNSGIQRPDYAKPGTVWLDESSSSFLSYKIFDGEKDVVLFNVNRNTGEILSYVSQDLYYKNGIPYWDVKQIGNYTNITIVARIVNNNYKLFKNVTGTATTTPPEEDTTNWNELLLGGGSPIGDIKYTSRTDVPNGGVWCDGTEYTQAEFPQVYQMLVDNKLLNTDYETFNNLAAANKSCGYFALDASTQKFKVPLLKDVYIKAGQAPSMFGAESLPKPFDIGSGLWINNSGNGIATMQGGIDNKAVLYSSSIYKDGAKVNPDHVIYRAYVVLYSSAVEASVAQAAEFINAIMDLRNDIAEINSALPTKKMVAYESVRSIKVISATEVSLQDEDEIIALHVSDNGNILVTSHSLTFPKPYYTVQLSINFPNGAKTFSISAPGKSIIWINGNTPDLSSGKAHYVVLRIAQGWDHFEASDAGEVG